MSIVLVEFDVPVQWAHICICTKQLRYDIGIHIFIVKLIWANRNEFTYMAAEIAILKGGGNEMQGKMCLGSVEFWNMIRQE